MSARPLPTEGPVYMVRIGSACFITSNAKALGGLMKLTEDFIPAEELWRTGNHGGNVYGPARHNGCMHEIQCRRIDSAAIVSAEEFKRLQDAALDKCPSDASHDLGPTPEATAATSSTSETAKASHE